MIVPMTLRRTFFPFGLKSEKQVLYCALVIFCVADSHEDLAHPSICSLHRRRPRPRPLPPLHHHGERLETISKALRDDRNSSRLRCEHRSVHNQCLWDPSIPSSRSCGPVDRRLVRVSTPLLYHFTLYLCGTVREALFLFTSQFVKKTCTADIVCLL